MWYLIIMIIWCLIGLSLIHLSNMAWKVTWYAAFHTHFDDEYPNDKWRDNILIYLLAAVVGPGLIIIHTDMFRKSSDWYIPKSLWMICYNRKKVETTFFS